jgi:hypothetical protein
MYQAIRPLDPDGVLQFEWLNSRGAIARFERNTIEIRILDTQETPAADLAIAGFCILVLQALIENRWRELAQSASITTETLAAILLDTIREGEHAVIRNAAYLELFGFPDQVCEAGELGYHLLESLPRVKGNDEEFWRAPLNHILHQGTLASRIRRALGHSVKRSHVEEIFRVLCECLVEDRLFEGIG